MRLLSESPHLPFRAGRIVPHSLVALAVLGGSCYGVLSWATRHSFGRGDR
jgi:hypothetical protein